VRARASYGPETSAQAANLAVGHYIPVYRAALLLCQLAGVAVSTGWMAGIRGKAAALVETSGFMEHVRELLKTAPAVHADETPARAARGTDATDGPHEPALFRLANPPARRARRPGSSDRWHAHEDLPVVGLQGWIA